MGRVNNDLTKVGTLVKGFYLNFSLIKLRVLIFFVLNTYLNMFKGFLNIFIIQLIKSK